MTLKVKLLHFLPPPHYTNSQNSTTSFGCLCWFSAKNLSNFVSLPWKLHNRYCRKSRYYYQNYEGSYSPTPLKTGFHFPTTTKVLPYSQQQGPTDEKDGEIAIRQGHLKIWTERWTQSNFWIFSLRGRNMDPNYTPGGLFGPRLFIILNFYINIYLLWEVKLYFESTWRWSLSCSNILLTNCLKLQILASYNNLRIRHDSEFAKFWPRA